MRQNTPKRAKNGAVFALYTKDSSKQITDADYDALSVQPEKQITVGEGSKAVDWYLYSVQTTDSDGKITWTDLTQECYYLVEVKAPDGYNLSYSSHEVSRTSNSVSVTATNTAGYELPNSGGMGTGMYTVVGLAMCAAAGLLFFLRRRRQIHA